MCCLNILNILLRDTRGNMAVYSQHCMCDEDSHQQLHHTYIAFFARASLVLFFGGGIGWMSSQSNKNSPNKHKLVLGAVLREFSALLAREQRSTRPALTGRSVPFVDSFQHVYLALCSFEVILKVSQSAGLALQLPPARPECRFVCSGLKFHGHHSLQPRPPGFQRSALERNSTNNVNMSTAPAPPKCPTYLPSIFCTDADHACAAFHRLAPQRVSCSRLFRLDWTCLGNRVSIGSYV